MQHRHRSRVGPATKIAYTYYPDARRIAIDRSVFAADGFCEQCEEEVYLLVTRSGNGTRIHLAVCPGLKDGAPLFRLTLENFASGPSEI